MKQELQNKLFKKYKKIFRQKDLPKEETCMCWGIDCPDEWYEILDMLCDNIQNYVKTKELIQVEAIQVKSKFGKLCFYHEPIFPWVLGAIAMAQSMIDKLPKKEKGKK